MPNPLYPGAVQVAGALRGYAATGGRPINLTTAIRHYTVGFNSIGTCGRDFQMLQARDGTLYQGAEVDAKNWGAGDPWNGCSVHIEAEWHPSMDEPVLNAAMIDTQRGFCAWLESEWGINRASSYHGPDRVTSWRGFIDHRWLIQTGDWHTNSWPLDAWEAICATAPTIEDDMKSMLIHKPGDLTVWVYDAANGTKTKVANMAALDGMRFLAGKTGLLIDGPDNGIYAAPAAFVDALVEIGAAGEDGTPGECRFVPAPTQFVAQ